MNYNITALFVCLDEFCKSFEEWEMLIGVEF